MFRKRPGSVHGCGDRFGEATREWDSGLAAFGAGDFLVGAFVDSYVEDIPEPKVEVHRFRRHVYRRRHCGSKVLFQACIRWQFLRLAY